MKIIVLGGGLVGSAIARDLSADTSFSVTVADISEQALSFCASHGMDTRSADLSNEQTLRSLVREFDLVVGAVPGYMGFQTLRTVIEQGKNIVDISFFPEDPFQLDALARENDVIAVMDCGLAPGLGNILMGRANEEMDSISSFLCYVGGLPLVRKKPFEYAAVFSPIDVIEEYTRPSRYIENGAEVVRDALSDVELLEFESIGTLEAFNSDGLRTLAVTMNAPYMKEKTMRYPGHADLMRLLRDVGLFGKETIDIGGNAIRPLDVAAKLLFPAWEMKDGEEDVSIMRVIIEGKKNNSPVKRVYELLDNYDRDTQTTSMARTTGYTCAAAARLIAKGRYTRPGISPPEYLGKDRTVYDELMAQLAQRNIRFTENQLC